MTARPRRARTDEARQERLQTILDAALDVFAERGFADTRLDEVARRAGIAKGTIYLYVPSKEGLFEALVRSGIAGPIEALQTRLAAADSAESSLRMLFGFIQREVLGTKRREIARIVLTEAPRFPEIARFYHREVIGRGIALLRGIVESGVARGELRPSALTRFPQLIMAPVLLAFLWSRLFDRFEPLDTAAMLDAHVDLLMQALKEERA